MSKHPIQPLALDQHGVLRFKENKIVSTLLDTGKLNMNDLAVMPFSQEDREQFAQLIGYSLSGYGELSYVSDETYETANQMYENKELSEQEAKIKYLEETLANVKSKLRDLTCTVFNIHPDDLK